MKKYFYCFFLLMFQFNVFGQCEDYQEQNARLITEKSELQAKLDNEEIAYDKLHLKYKREIEERKKYERLYYFEKSEKERLQLELTKITSEFEIIEAERDKLRREIKELEDAKLTDNKEYKDKIIAVQSLNSELNIIKKNKKEFETQVEEGEAAVVELKKIISQLEDEAQDRISVSQKKIYFNKKEYGYGEEIIFIEFEQASTNNMTIKQEDEYYIKRIAKLASKYDFRVKVSLEGESSDSNEKERRRLAEGRVDKVKSTMIVDYELKAEDFGKSKIVKAKARIGVSVKIEKR